MPKKQPKPVKVHFQSFQELQADLQRLANKKAVEQRRKRKP